MRNSQVTERNCSKCEARAVYVLFHEGTEKPRAFACEEHAEGARGDLAPWLAELEAYMDASRRARETEDAAYQAQLDAYKKRQKRRKKLKKKRKRKGRKMGVTLHAIAEVAYSEGSGGDGNEDEIQTPSRAYWDLFDWSLNKAYDVMIALDAHAHTGWPENATDHACELEDSGEADSGQQWATLEELRAIVPHVRADYDDEAEAKRGAQTSDGASLHLRAMIAALEVFAAGAAVPVRVLFYRC